jgi:TPR repeat protein
MSPRRYKTDIFIYIVYLFLFSIILPVTTTTVELSSNGIASTISTQKRLLPSEINKLSMYMDWKNTTVQLPFSKKSFTVAKGYVKWPRPINRVTKFSVIPSVMTHQKVKNALKILRTVDFDIGLDTVDAMPTQELYIHKGGHEMSTEDAGYQSRSGARSKLTKLLAPVEAIITEYVRHNWPQVCNKALDRKCRACFSLVRKYFEEERQSHMMHRDGQALVTAVVSLSDYGRDFTGGLYVAANGQGRQVIALRKGDVVLHQYDLLHGVQVEKPTEKGKHAERWSWIMWFKDSQQCNQHGYEWSRNCAKKGDALCQYTYGWRIFLNPALTSAEKVFEREKWMTKSAHNGFGEAMFKIGRNHLGRQNITGADYWFRKAIEAGDPDASYQVGHLLLLGILKGSSSSSSSGIGIGSSIGSSSGSRSPATTNSITKDKNSIALQLEVIQLYENAAKWGSSPFAGAPFAMYNLGVAWLYGYGGLKRNPNIAAKWFELSGLPEGMMAMSLYKKSKGKYKVAKRLKRKAKMYGFGNRPSRDQALFGLHSNWPKGPPKW